MFDPKLTERERNVLRYIVQQFILTASPVGSRNMTRRYDLNFSPATVRNIMSDLEDSGFINHPHTSAGRVPTDKGYRFYVDSLMQIAPLGIDTHAISSQLDALRQGQTDELLSVVSKILSSITHQLACVLYPKLDSGILEKIQLVWLSSTRMLVVISISSGIVKTITIEIHVEINENLINRVQELLNERLSGLALSEIRNTFHDRIKDFTDELHPILSIFFDSVDKIFADARPNDKAIISGAGNLLKQPEFDNPERFQSVVQLIEDKDIIIHVFEKSISAAQNNVSITIGSENVVPELGDFSLVTKEYEVGDVKGTLGVVGPKRMEYEKIVAIVDYVATMLTQILTNK